MPGADTHRTSITAQPADPHVARLGEGPWWSKRDGRLLWVDVLRGEVLAHDPARGRSSVLFRASGLTTAAVDHEAGGLLAVLEDAVVLVPHGPSGAGPDDVEQLAAIEADRPETRCNDAAVAPDGHLWVGTMLCDGKGSTASLYRLTTTGPIAMRHGLTVSNGLGWSPDAAVLHHVDSGTRTLDDLVVLEHEATVRRLRRHTFDPTAGKPDGLAVDEDGGVWVALWGGGVVHRINHRGRVDAAVAVPATHPTSCAFGGDDLNVLYITTAGVGVGGQGKHAGRLCAVDVGVKGALVATRAASVPGL